MFSRALLTKLNCLDFCVFKGQSHDKVCLFKTLWLPLHDAVVVATFCKSEKLILHLEPTCLKNHNF
jgi:hypothetical protein